MPEPDTTPHRCPSCDQPETAALDAETVRGGRRLTTTPAPAGPAETIARLREELAAAREQLAAFREGEEPYEDEALIPTPAQWIWQWNRAPLARRLEVIEAIQAAQADAWRCQMGCHDGRLAELGEALRRANHELDRAATKWDADLDKRTAGLVARAEQAEATVARVRVVCDKPLPLAHLEHHDEPSDEERGWASAMAAVEEALTPPAEGMDSASYPTEGEK